MLRGNPVTFNFWENKNSLKHLYHSGLIFISLHFISEIQSGNFFPPVAFVRVLNTDSCPLPSPVLCSSEVLPFASDCEELTRNLDGGIFVLIQLFLNLSLQFQISQGITWQARR